ncbi:DUF2889 domain-containing protein [Ralstonia pseudosolanacearum]|uniref:DUF2889 domain-containing protein n=1 Tax=Ralstonia pseudosolanacearum TaxID=1310165 RepID=UPI000490D3B0|nr:DUF2889 domain-containing protein [Ralstonia pseudosolanacearum]MCL1620587.1 DUF2889 domain-containing protein [Ralstonia pseudosolanacearum CaRs-Mep]MCQ4679872.1 DUF2889 domain-containing protein [Ralstonia pseudosolanacearum]
MPLSNPVPRVARHRRAITVEAYLREDGLWDIEARLMDTKPHDIPLVSGRVRPQGQPLHDLWLRVTIDIHMNVVDAEACSDWVPYPTHCDTIGPAYRNLVGLNLMKGFRKAARERLGGVAGCTHLTELCAVLPTAAIQAFPEDALPVRDHSNDHRSSKPGETPPYQLHGCHALHFEGEVVRKHYPRWFAYQPASRIQPPIAEPSSGTSS